MKILDYGCGNGDNVFFHARNGCESIGVDLDVDKAKLKYPQLDFIRIADEKLPFTDESFEAVYANDVLEHVVDLSLAISEINRVLLPQGRLYASIPYFKTEIILAGANPGYLKQIGHQRIFKAGELEAILSKNGFQIISKKQKGSFMFFSLWLLFKAQQDIISERGDFSDSSLYKLLMIMNQFFDAEITFKTKAKYIPIWLLAWPIAWIFDKMYPKTFKLIAVKK